MKNWIIFVGFVLLLALTWFVVDRFALFRQVIVPGEVVTIPSTPATPTTPLPAEASVVPYQLEEVASGLNTVWGIVFTSPDRILLTERPGRLRVVEQGQLREEPLHLFPELSTGGEIGLMSLALDPDYDENKFIYVSLGYKNDGRLIVKVVRFQDGGTSLSDERVVIDNIPAAANHAGCRIAFGPDGKLYITTGDATDRNIAQDLNSLGGKLLRINSDGSIPSDNPFPDSPVWSYGHRNAQGIAWSQDGELYSSEHGPTVFDGPAGGDEVNRIVKSGNYGWPLVSHEKTKAGTIAPLKVFTPAEAPASIMSYSGKIFPQFKNNLFFGCLVGKGLMRLVVDESDPDKILQVEKLAEVKLGRIRDVVEGPDGFIYFSTSNRDGRGSPAESDDRVFRIVPL